MEDPLWKSLLIKLQASRHQCYQKWNFSACTFQDLIYCVGERILRNVFLILLAASTIYFHKYRFCVQWFVLCAIDFIEMEFLKLKIIFRKHFLNDYSKKIEAGITLQFFCKNQLNFNETQCSYFLKVFSFKMFLYCPYFVWNILSYTRHQYVGGDC